ncbi:hypothetical protein BDV23DRAFT_170655 [Aspergillus alliaceus]|uniref:Major facilitator superfamily domain-containing protein n=1 Tax=Petromyces alliaceus TaxID=209559 RepID=A0A5N7CF34_PETAA|nr:hypothetical protein BDV23DRAFT_170655 [Aspergillus alliaceus]
MAAGFHFPILFYRSFISTSAFGALPQVECSPPIGFAHASSDVGIKRTGDCAAQFQPSKSITGINTPLTSIGVEPEASPSKTKWRLLSACRTRLGGGMNDSAPGALIPYIEENYSTGYAVVPLSFSFFLLGFGLELQLALNNVFCANLANATTALGFLHGSYEISGIMGPLIAPALAFHGDRWSFYYALTMALAQNASHQEHERGVSNQKHSLKQAVKTRTTLLGALFIFAYQGAEFYRGGDPSRVGYMSAGLWAGITLGRFVLSRLTHMIEEKLSIVTRLIPNVIGDVVAVALVGLLLGPVYPCATTVFSKLLPRSIQVSSLNFIVH